MQNLEKLVLIAAENLGVRARIARVLQSAGYTLELASSWQRGLQLASKHRFDVAIVVASSGFPLTMIKGMRETISRILILAETSNEVDGLKSLSRADAVLPISVSDEFLLDKLTRMMARSSNADVPSIISLENCRIDLAAQVFVDGNGREIQLTPAETALLKELAREAGQVRSRDDLRQAIAGRAADRFDRSIDMLVARLRNKIEPNPRAPQFILTVPKIGYKFVTQNQAALRPALAHDAQRRQLTIVSCNVANWKAFAFGLDPEDLSDISHKFRATAEPIITRMGGTIFGRKAEALLACFCYPQSSERDAELALRATLEILHKLGALRGTIEVEPQIKIGIATGLAVISGIEPIGEPVELAIALRDAAPSNSVVIDSNTCKLLDGGISFEALEPHSLPELPKPISGFRVVAENLSKAPVSPAFAGRDLIGRDGELQQLFRLWERAKRWHGQVAVLSGDPGIGKSCLCEAFIDRISNEPHKLIRYQCTPLLRNTPLHPIIAQIEQEFGIHKDDISENKLEKLRTALPRNQRANSDELSLYTELLSLAGEDALPAKANTKQNRDRLIARLARHVADLAFEEPLVVVIADPQWADSSALQFIDEFVRCAKAAPLLVLFQCRPEYSPAWLGAPHVSLLSLDRLAREDALSLLSKLSGAKLLSADTKEQIIGRADGVPLFIEEITRSVLESIAVPQAHEGDSSDSSGTIAEVPATLLGSLTARLDRLGEAKEVAHAAAAIGAECSYDLLRTVVKIPTEKLDDHLRRLVAAQLLCCRGVHSNRVYTFKHALLRDAAYSTLLKGRRAHLHEAIANALVQQLSAGRSVHAEVIARHYSEAQKHREALQYWQEAAKYAASRSANKEAIGHLNEALKQVAQADAATRNKAELDLQTMLGNSLRAIEGWAAEAVKAAYSRALQLCDSRTPDEDVFGPVFGLWAWHFVRALLGESQAYADRLMIIAGSTADPVYEVLGRQALGFVLFARGRFEIASTELERSIRLCDDRYAPKCLSLSGQDPRVHGRLYRALTLWFLGFIDQALVLCAEALRLAQLCQDPFSEAMARTITLRVHQLRGEPDVVADQADAAIAFSKEYGFVHYLAMSLILRGWATAAQGDIEKGIAEISEGLQIERTKGALIYETYALGLLADACIKHERYEQALGFLRRAMQILEQDNSACFYAAEIYRLTGEASFGLSGNPSDAEHYISEGLKLARAQNAKSLELKLYVTLCDLYRDRDTRQLIPALRDVFESLNEGYDTSDLLRARRILEVPGPGTVRLRKGRRSQEKAKSTKEILRTTARSTQDRTTKPLVPTRRVDPRA
jgi:DNA-binding response OmpR family regulator/class 3 adenylate cyclase/tetratricopeptide (TPR) repeat protein